MPTHDVLTVRLPPEVRKRLDALARSTDRSRSWLTVEALNRYLQDNAWQVTAIEEGLADSRAGRLVENDEVEGWLETWGKTGKRKRAR